MEPRAIHPKGGRAAGAAKTAEKPGAGRAFGTNKGGGGPNKIGLLCGSANQKKKTLDLTAGEYTIARYRETIFENFPRTLLFLSPMRKDGQQKNRRGDARLGSVSARRNRENRAAWVHRRASVLQTAAREDHQNEKEKQHRVAICHGEKLGPLAIFQAKHHIATNANSNQGAVSPVFAFQSLFCGNPGKNCRSREVFLCG